MRRTTTALRLGILASRSRQSCVAVLDGGCGTGENALHIASLGLSVLGVDLAETALAMAREKAGDRGIEVGFAAADALIRGESRVDDRARWNSVCVVLQ
jgi:2-polyprenyl-3-methyl-5-hydroxy-6-metoxy-1,4-benzoquinol methylase